MIFLPPALTAGANKYVASQPEDRNPRFPRKDGPGIVRVRGGILRYSTTSAPRGDRA